VTHKKDQQLRAKFYQPFSTSLFWSIVNRAKNPKQTPTIPTLPNGRPEFKSEKEKVELFKSILKETFSDVGSDEEFDQTFKLSMSNTTTSFKTISYNFRFTSLIKEI